MNAEDTYVKIAEQNFLKYITKNMQDIMKIDLNQDEEIKSGEHIVDLTGLKQILLNKIFGMNSTDFLIGLRNKNNIFLISKGSEKGLNDKLKREFILYTIVGSAFILLGIAIELFMIF